MVQITTGNNNPNDIWKNRRQKLFGWTSFSLVIVLCSRTAFNTTSSSSDDIIQTKSSSVRSKASTPVAASINHLDLTSFVLSNEENNERLDALQSAIAEEVRGMEKTRSNKDILEDFEADTEEDEVVVVEDDNPGDINNSASVSEGGEEDDNDSDITSEDEEEKSPNLRLSPDTTVLSSIGSSTTKPVIDSTTNLPLCNRNQIVNGKWIPNRLKRPPYVTPTVHLRCYPKEAYYDEKHGWNTWKWHPFAKKSGECYIPSLFDRREFCRLMQDGVVSIVGDSLSWEQYSSLVQLNGIRTHQNYQHQSRELQMNIFQSVCNGHSKVLYRRDDLLQNLTHSIQQDFPVVLVLNRGAHYKPDDELMADIRHNIQELKDHWIPKCISQKIKCHLFWRTSVPGHPGCSKDTGKIIDISKNITKLESAYTEPNNSLEEMEALIGDLNNYNDHTLLYHWYDYQHQNEIVVQEFQKELGSLTSPYFHLEFIDAYYLNVRRPDEHRAHQGDCLHNCYPGKMDVYNLLMLHYLRIQRTEEDIKYLHQIVTEQALWNVNETTKYDPKATEQARKERESNKHGHHRRWRL